MAMTTPGITGEKSLQGQPSALEGSVFFKGLNAVS